MSAFSPTAAAFEGFRLLRREPGAVAAWVAGNIVLFVLIALSKVGQPGLHLAPLGATPGLRTVGRFGPLAYVAAPLLLVFWVVLVAAIFRQELRPDERRWAFMRLGGDEVRLALLGIAGGALVFVLAGIQFAAVAAITQAADHLYPSGAKAITLLAAAVAFCFNFWIVVRLSLAPAHTFAARRLSIFGSWSITRRHFWALGWMILLMIVTVFIVFFVLTLLAGVMGAESLRALDAHRLVHPSIALIGGLFLLVLLLIAAQVIVSVLIYAPLAFAYRALAVPEKV